MASRVRAKATEEMSSRLNPSELQEISKRPMVVACGFETNPNGQGQTVQKLCKGPEFLGGVLYTKFFRLSIRALRRELRGDPWDIDGYPDNGFRRTLAGWSWLVRLLVWMLNTLTVPGDLRLTMANRASGRFAPFSPVWSTPLGQQKTPSFRGATDRRFVAKDLRSGLAKVGTGTLYIEPGRSLREAAVACLAAWISIATASESLSDASQRRSQVLTMTRASRQAKSRDIKISDKRVALLARPGFVSRSR